MANISSKSSIDVLLSMKPSEFESLTRRELAPIVSRLNDMARKRIQRIEASGEYSPAVSYMQRTGGIESIRGKDLTDLRNHYLRVRTFLTNKTSTLKGTRKAAKTQAEIIAEQAGVPKDFIDQKMDADARGMVWELIDRASKGGLANVRLNYQKYVGAAVQAITENEGKSKDEIFDDFMENIANEYEQENTQDTLSLLFHMGDDE